MRMVPRTAHRQMNRHHHNAQHTKEFNHPDSKSPRTAQYAPGAPIAPLCSAPIVRCRGGRGQFHILQPFAGTVPIFVSQPAKMGLSPSAV
jgi:hypothetical protein